MKNIRTFLFALTALSLLASFSACQQAGKNKTGSEFIPDMTHSVAYEANVYTGYSLNTFDDKSSVKLRELDVARMPVKGTVPRGYAGIGILDHDFASPEEAVKYTQDHIRKNFIPMTPDGYVPYYFPDTEEGRLEASAKILYNPFPITAKGLARGKALYDIYCGICHGPKGDGSGYLVRDDGAYPAAPANFLLDKFVNASNGQIYHAIMYGKNVMGSYKDKLSFEERWQVIHYIRSLQAKAKNLTYDENENTLNADFGVPVSKLSAEAATDAQKAKGDESQNKESGQ